MDLFEIDGMDRLFLRFCWEGLGVVVWRLEFGLGLMMRGRMSVGGRSAVLVPLMTEVDILCETTGKQSLRMDQESSRRRREV